jgi:hypothetical protein
MKHQEVIQVIVSLEASNKKERVNKLRHFANKLWRAYRRHAFKIEKPRILQRLKLIAEKNKIIEEYRNKES